LEFGVQLASAVEVGQPQEASWKAEFGPWHTGFWDTRPEPEIKWLPLLNEGDACGEKLQYPSWLEGTWEVAYKKQEVKFPKGWGFASTSMPGFGMASILRLPNVGNEPRARWSFVADGGGGVRADWESMLPSILQSFWDKAYVSTAPLKIPGVGWVLTYTSHLWDAPKGFLTERNVTSTWLGSDSFEEAQGFSSVEWIRQRDGLDAPDGVYDYKVLTALQRGSNGTVSGLLRVAGFLQPLDDAYIEANGEPVAVYDYSLDLKRPSRAA